MKFSKLELLAAFDAVAPGLAQREVLAQAQSFVFYDGRVYTFNDRIAVSYAMPDGWDIETSAKASELHKILHKMDGEQVDVALVEGALIVSTPATRLKVKTEAEVAKHHETIGVPDEWFELPEEFCGAIQRASFCASKSIQRPLLTFVHIHEDIVEAVDNNRLLLQKLSVTLPEFLIPRDAVDALVSFKCNAVGFTEGWVHFQNEVGAVFSTRIMDCADYPKLDKIMDVEGVQVMLPIELRSGIEKAQEVLDSKESLPFVHITTKGGILMIEAAGPYAEVCERYHVDFKEELDFNIHPGVLADALGVSCSCTVGKDRLRLASVEKDFVHVCALSVVRQAAPEAEEGAAEAPAAEEPPVDPVSTKAKRGRKAKTPPPEEIGDSEAANATNTEEIPAF